VLVTAFAVEDGRTPPPEVGQERFWTLEFAEATGVGPDSTVVEVPARAEPEGPPLGPERSDMGTEGEPRRVWSTRLSGVGWSATWWAARLITGLVSLRGWLVNDLHGYLGITAGVRGRVTRVQMVTETYEVRGGEVHRLPDLQRLPEVGAAPRWFDHGLVPDLPPGPVEPGWYPMKPPAEPYAAQTGVLVDLAVVT
jgi:hypothetical protein